MTLLMYGGISVMAKTKSHNKTIRHGKAKTAATQNSLSKMKNSRQSKIAAQNKKVTS